jgi:hypothetical protein
VFFSTFENLCFSDRLFGSAKPETPNEQTKKTQNQTLYVFEPFFSFVFFLIIRGGRRANQENQKSNFVRF